MTIIPLRAFADNYIGPLHDGRQAPAVEPGVARPVPDVLQQDSLQLAAILVNPILRSRESTMERAVHGWQATPDNNEAAAVAPLCHWRKEFK